MTANQIENFRLEQKYFINILVADKCKTGKIYWRCAIYMKEHVLVKKH